MTQRNLMARSPSKHSSAEPQLPFVICIPRLCRREKMLDDPISPSWPLNGAAKESPSSPAPKIWNPDGTEWLTNGTGHAGRAYVTAVVWGRRPGFCQIASSPSQPLTSW
jgi:hypothetical protein